MLNTSYLRIRFSSVFSDCIRILYPVRCFCYGNTVTDTNRYTSRDESERGLAKNPLPKPHPLHPKRHIFWKAEGRWQVNSSLAGHSRPRSGKAPAVRFPQGTPPFYQRERRDRQRRSDYRNVSQGVSERPPEQGYDEALQGGDFDCAPQDVAGFVRH